MLTFRSKTASWIISFFSRCSYLFHFFIIVVFSFLLLALISYIAIFVLAFQNYPTKGNLTIFTTHSTIPWHAVAFKSIDMVGTGCSILAWIASTFIDI